MAAPSRGQSGASLTASLSVQSGISSPSSDRASDCASPSVYGWWSGIRAQPHHGAGLRELLSERGGVAHAGDREHAAPTQRCERCRCAHSDVHGLERELHDGNRQLRAARDARAATSRARSSDAAFRVTMTSDARRSADARSRYGPIGSRRIRRAWRLRAEEHDVGNARDRAMLKRIIENCHVRTLCRRALDGLESDSASTTTGIVGASRACTSGSSSP